MAFSRSFGRANAKVDDLALVHTAPAILAMSRRGHLSLALIDYRFDLPSETSPLSRCDAGSLGSAGLGLVGLGTAHHSFTITYYTICDSPHYSILSIITPITLTFSTT